MIKCPNCKEEFTPTIKEIAKLIEDTYPPNIFVGHPVAWVRRLLKFLVGMDYRVLVDEEKYTDWENISRRFE